MREWWREGVIYQVYSRSFADFDGDGVGDLRGLIGRLDHLEWLGVDAVWLSPITVSPDRDWGYDVADYRNVQPVLGTLDDVDALIAEAGRRGIRVLLDIVPNHTSDQHPWFQEARAARDSARRDWYLWADPKADGSPPNNWLSSFGGPAWTLDPGTGQYYMHNFLPEQPDLNWWNPEVRAEFEAILRFWFDRGVAGFRIDVCDGLIKDRELRDNPTAAESDPPWWRRRGQVFVYNRNRPEVHQVLREWRALCEQYDPPRLLLGETAVMDVSQMTAFLGRGDEIQLAMNFLFAHSRFGPDLAAVVEATAAVLPEAAWPVWHAGNHDISRYATRWALGDERLARCALMMLLTLRGTPILYYGDEIGMTDVEVPPEAVRDEQAHRPTSTIASPGRDPERTPMQWSAAPGAGFSGPGVTPWLPLGDHRRINVASQRADHDSMLNLCRDLLQLRRSRSDLVEGSYIRLESPPRVWAWRRGTAGLVVAVNLGGYPVTIPGTSGRVLLGTRRARDRHKFEGELRLEPWEGVVAQLFDT